MAETAEADVWLIKQAGLGLATAGSHDTTTAARWSVCEYVSMCVCVCAVSKQVHVAHQKDLPQREGRQKKEGRREGGRANEKAGHEGEKEEEMGGKNCTYMMVGSKEKGLV